jgi:hypothetical protein
MYCLKAQTLGVRAFLLISLPVSIMDQYRTLKYRRGGRLEEQPAHSGAYLRPQEHTW